MKAHKEISHEKHRFPDSGLLLAADKPKDDDAKLIQGKWQAVAIEDNGKKVDVDEKHPKSGTYTFTADKVVIEGANFKEEATYKLDSTRTPKAIAMARARAPEDTTAGIYELNGDELKLCYVPLGKVRPTEFKTTVGSESVVVTFKRVK